MDQKLHQTVAVIGGGASGMIAAISAAECGAEVVLLERQARVGRKLAATGNGRCNITNLNASFRDYHGKNTDYANYALQCFGPEKTVRYFRDLGLLCVSEAGGRCYPYSDSANSVVDILRFALDARGITVKCGARVTQIEKKRQSFFVRCEEESLRADRVIIACGGQAGAKLGGVKDGYSLLEGFGHSCTKLYPSLVQLKTDGSFTRALKGVRTNCEVQVVSDGIRIAVSSGELQFTEYGLSGPVIFDISLEARRTGRSEIVIDYFPNLSRSELMTLLTQKSEHMSAISSDELFTGLLQNRLGKMIVKECGLSGRLLGQLSGAELAAACRKAKEMHFSVTGDLGFDSAQVTSGGIAVKDFDSHTMESRLCKGLYACGEVLDIDGPCGGYNLQWAWSSGRVAGLAAGSNYADHQ